MDKITPNKQLTEFLLKESYISAIQNSVGSSQFRNLYAKVNSEKQDILRDGDLSCAYYVSSILAPFQLVKTAHATVKSTLRDMGNCGWEESKQLRVGCVLLWGEKYFKESGESHGHMGFYIGKNMAVSNSSKKKCPTMHAYKTHDGRPLVKIFWHPALEK